MPVPDKEKASELLTKLRVENPNLAVQIEEAIRKLEEKEAAKEET